jgi:hypothetical protein
MWQNSTSTGKSGIRNGSPRHMRPPMPSNQAYLTLDIRRHNGHLYHATWAAALCSYTPQVPLSTPICRLEISGAYDCAMNVAINSAYAMSISSVDPINDKAEMHFKLDEAVRAEYAEQCQLVRAIFGNPFSPPLSG